MIDRKPQAINDLDSIAEEQSDPFLEEALNELNELDYEKVDNQKPKFSSGKVFLSAVFLLVILSLGLWTSDLINTLFEKYELAGFIALLITIIGLIALIFFVIGEVRAIMRLASVDKIRLDAEEATKKDDIARARHSVDELIRYTARSPYITQGRKTMQSHRQDIIDGKALIHLAEYELLRPLDMEARKLILNSAKRVSVVTAVSPRAIIDLGYVLYEVVGLIRRLSTLYGARPGRFGLFALIKRVISHLAVTGTLAVGDGLVEQFIGQGLTTRIGIATMDALRPFPFDGEKRPGISDFTGDLIGLNRNRTKENLKKATSSGGKE